MTKTTVVAVDNNSPDPETGNANSVPPFLQYIALLSQASALDAPTMNVMANTIDDTFTFTRYSTGRYKATVALPIDRTFIPQFGNTAGSVLMPIGYDTIGDFYFTMYVNFATFELMVEVYNAAYQYVDLATVGNGQLKLPVHVMVLPI